MRSVTQSEFTFAGESPVASTSSSIVTPSGVTFLITIDSSRLNGGGGGTVYWYNIARPRGGRKRGRTDA